MAVSASDPEAKNSMICKQNKTHQVALIDALGKAGNGGLRHQRPRCIVSTIVMW